MRAHHRIDIVPRHTPLGDGSVHEEYAVICPCGFYDKVGDAPTNAGRRRQATYLAMQHNHKHGNAYQISKL